MKFCIRIALSMCVAALLATPASACCLFPFGGWWGAGYYGSPAYTAPAYSSYYSAPSYTSFYGAFSAPSYGCCGTAAPAYSASYGSFGSYDGGCCTNSCCQSSCGSGCASGSCGGTTPAGTLKPAQDPISDKKAPSYEDDPRSRRFVPESRSPRDPAADDPLDPVNEKDRYDRFERSRTRESEPANPGTDGTRNPGMFDTIDPQTERSNQKPEMPDVLEDLESEPADPGLGNEVDEKTFYEDKSNRDNTTSRSRDAVIARSSSLSEVIAPKRLASRSLPSGHRSAARSTLADKSSKTQSDAPRPVRWISAPLADGHVQL
ncbi:MAG: hypothetical protein R3C17_18185 [Planctomycetaceae bacterium]